MAAADAKIFVRNPIEALIVGRMTVTLNGEKIAELGSLEAVAIDAPVGQNKLGTDFEGVFLTLPENTATREFSMVAGQKRFFIAEHKFVHILIGKRLAVIEITQDEFFRY